MSEPETTTVEINGFPARVWRKGSGPPVGFLGGFGGLPRWVPFLDRLAERRTVVVPSLPGFPGGDRGHSVLDTHLDWLLATRHLLDARRIALLRPGTTVINTARGSLIDQTALTERLSTGDITAVLDVSDPWVPITGDPLYTMPNVLITPHIAGSMGTEVRRLAAEAVAEARRIARGRAAQHAVRLEDLPRLA